MIWVIRQATLMIDYIEEHAEGQAEIEVVNYSGSKLEVRKHLYKQFGAGSSGDIHDKELDFEKGMPENGKKAFPKGCDITVKLRQLEARRLYFFRMCEPSKRNTYIYCQESKLVRIVLEHIGQDHDYKDCVSRVLDLVKVKKMIQGSRKKGSKKGSLNLNSVPDMHERSFSDDWLPSWMLLSSSLTSEYKKLLKASGDSYSKGTNVNKGKLPVAFGGVKEFSCYGCGGPHKKGDPECKAGKYDVHSCAPADYKARMDRKRKNDASSSGGTNNDGNRAPKKSKKYKEGEKKPCKAFNFGKGKCRFGAKCKFSHDTKQSKVKDEDFTPKQNKMIQTMLAAAMKKTAVLIAKKSKSKKQKKQKDEKDDSDNESIDYGTMLASVFLAPIRNTIPRELVVEGDAVIMVSSLHNVEKNCGIDTDAGISISTMKSDFPLWIDESASAKASIASPSGINGGRSAIGGRGPMVVRAKSGEYLIDPDAVFLEPSKTQPNFRVMSTQRLKMNGLRLVQCFNDSNIDVLQDRLTKRTVNLSEEGPEGTRILVVDTLQCPVFRNLSKMKSIVNDIRKRNRSAMVVIDEEGREMIEAEANVKDWNEEEDLKVMAFNVAKCTDEERSRLFSRRFGYCNPDLLVKMSEDKDFGVLPKFVSLNEDNFVKDCAKFHKKPHHRTDPELARARPPWFRVYLDGYGGGKSMGSESYEGAIGGYLFVCSSTGDVHHKLYASHEQFPAALFQFLVYVEAEGHRCHELYCDTFSVNISNEAEEVAGLFQARIVPVSSGTPQEVSFVESQVRVVAERSRAMLLGAPHLPSWCWALADKHAVNVGRHLPQSTRGWKSAAFLSSSKVPHWRSLCIHVFGSPCLYAPTEGPVHKRSAITLEGFYVGVQHPMVLILRKPDMKLISCSTKKFVCHESVYTLPLSCPSSTLKSYILRQKYEGGDKDQTADDEKEENVHQEEASSSKGSVGPTHIQSVKSVSSHSVPVPSTSGPSYFRGITKLDASAQSQALSQGEGVVSPEHLAYNDDLQAGLKDLKARVKEQIEDPGIRQKVLDSLTKANGVLAHEVERGQLKLGKRKAGHVTNSNIVSGKRLRLKCVDERKNKKKKDPGKFELKPGDAVSACAEAFDRKDEPGSFSKDHPERQYGSVVRVWPKRGQAQVAWDDGYSIHNLEELTLEKVKANAAFFVTLMMTEALKPSRDSIDKAHWPKDFFQALVSPEWRDWVLAVKKEIASWLAFNAYSIVDFKERKAGSSIVPLGELYTRKRDGSFKFRQYLMGNLLKKGKDFDETFSSCISWDGIRWFAAVACVTGKKIFGLDAVTGFLQAKEQFDLYAFLPSHAQYSDLSIEDLAKVRLKLLDLIKKEGNEGLRKFAAAHKKESRSNPKKCYRLNSSIYGAPSANHEFEMLFQNAHINKCGLTLSEVEPSLYVKIQVDVNDDVTGWMLATIWTDDVRYIGTDSCVKEYEAEIQKHVKVKFLDVPGEFVGTEFHQNLELGLCELKSPKYWESALQKLKHYFPNGVKERWNPMSVHDEKLMMEEVADEDFEEAKHLEYREVCGIISYAATCTKLEMRYSISVCGRHRSKWGKKQFNIMMKVFEYGYTTREMGVIYSRGLDLHGDNTLYCYADSAHSLPRSYGCTIVMMNGGMLSLSAKRHTLTASSTCHDEIIEFAIAVNRVVGFRNMMCEMGLEQGDATTIYQDNEAAIHLAMNRGALSKQSRHIERKVLAARNKVEDHDVMPKKIPTESMLADMGTKALPDGQFVFLRDEANGYALVKRNHPSYKLPSYVSNAK